MRYFLGEPFYLPYVHSAIYVGARSGPIHGRLITQASKPTRQMRAVPHCAGAGKIDLTAQSARLPGWEIISLASVTALRYLNTNVGGFP